MNPLVQLAIQETPSVVAALKDLFKSQNPGAPEPTNEEVIAAFNTAFQSSLDKDDAWIAAHPEDIAN